MIAAPNFAPCANIGSKKVYEIEENSILIPDYYMFYGNWDWLAGNGKVYEQDWDNKIEKAIFRGNPTGLRIELFEEGVPIDASKYGSVQKVYDHFEKHKHLFQRLEAVRLSSQHP